MVTRETVAFTVATREKMSVYRRLGGTRMAAAHSRSTPSRVVRMAVQSVLEWLREEFERAAAQFASRATHAEGIFPSFAF